MINTAAMINRVNQPFSRFGSFWFHTEYWSYDASVKRLSGTVKSRPAIGYGQEEFFF
jgi:hypothetical protein